MSFGYEQQMHRRVRVNVFKHDKGICFVQYVRIRLAMSDATENAILFHSEIASFFDVQRFRGSPDTHVRNCHLNGISGGCQEILFK
jgi:hypothetical protein